MAGQLFLSPLAVSLFPTFGGICCESSIGKGKFSYFGHRALTLGEAKQQRACTAGGVCPSSSEGVVLSDAPSFAETQERQFTTKYQIKERQAFTFYISVYLQLV